MLKASDFVWIGIHPMTYKVAKTFLFKSWTYIHELIFIQISRWHTVDTVHTNICAHVTRKSYINNEITMQIVLLHARFPCILLASCLFWP